MNEDRSFTFEGKGGRVGISFQPSCHLSQVRCPVCGEVITSTADPREVFADAEDYWAHPSRPYGWHFESRSRAGRVEVRCGCGEREIDSADLALRPKVKIGRGYFGGRAKQPSLVAKLGVLGADWVGSYGSPDSRDEDVALVFFGGIPEVVRENWTAILMELKDYVDLIAVGVVDSNVVEVLTADPAWPHPVEDIQNCLHQTVPALAGKVRYIPPAERDTAAKEAQCQAWLEHYTELSKGSYRGQPDHRPALDLWSKRAGFIGIQLLALHRGEDAGYTKESVGAWAAENIRLLDPRSSWLPPVDHPQWEEGRGLRNHDHQRAYTFLNEVVEDASYRFVKGARVVGELKNYGQAPLEVVKTEWWEPRTPLVQPPQHEDAEQFGLGICPLCGGELEYPEVYPRYGIYFSSTLVHPVCMGRVQAELIDLSDGICHLEFGGDGTPYWVAGEYFSASRIEYAVWDANWDLVEKTSGAPDHPGGDFW